MNALRIALAASQGLFLAACGSMFDGSASVNTALADFEVMPRAPEDSCVVSEGRFVLGPGVVIRCAGADETENRGPGNDDSAVVPSSPQPAAESPRPATSYAAPPPDNLARTLRSAEGQPSSFPYCDPAGLHVGDGIFLGQYLADSEREALFCEAIEDARKEAERTIGDVWPLVDQARRDAWTEVCYAASCATFDRAILGIRAGDYSYAAGEILDSCLGRNKPGCRADSANPERARRIAETIRTGRRM